MKSRYTEMATRIVTWLRTPSKCATSKFTSMRELSTIIIQLKASNLAGTGSPWTKTSKHDNDITQKIEDRAWKEWSTLVTSRETFSKRRNLRIITEDRWGNIKRERRRHKLTVNTGNLEQCWRRQKDVNNQKPKNRMKSTNFRDADWQNIDWLAGAPHRDYCFRKVERKWIASE